MIGCSAGFLNGVKIKGSHTAIKSGMVAAEAAYDLLAADPTMAVAETGEINTEEPALEIEEYPVMMDKSWVRLMGCIRPCLCLAFYFPSRMRGVRGFVAITPSDGGYGAWRNVLFVASCDTSMWVVQVYDELKEVRNCHASFEHGLVPGLAYTALSSFVLKGRESWNAAEPSARLGQDEAGLGIHADRVPQAGRRGLVRPAHEPPAQRHRPRAQPARTFARQARAWECPELSLACHLRRTRAEVRMHRPSPSEIARAAASGVNALVVHSPLVLSRGFYEESRDVRGQTPVGTA